MATGGYMLTPVDKNISKDKSFECSICHALLRDALETPCEHAFCKQCISQWEQTRRNELLEMKCPLCNENYDVDKVRRIGTINRIIRSQLKVFCPEKESGCNWEGTIDDFEEHESDECLYAVIGCPHEGCDDSAPRHEIDSHAKDTCVYREYDCQYCNEVFTFIEVELGDHWEKCLEFPADCENCGEELTRAKVEDHLEKCLEAQVDCLNEKCDEELLRGDLEDHLARHCPFERTACPFLEVGCLTKVERGKIDTHISSHSDHHSKMLLHSFLTIRDILTETKTELNKTNESLEETKEGLAETKEELHETKEEQEETKDELQETKKELKDSKNELQEMKEEQKETKKQLQETKKERQEAKEEQKETKKELLETKKELRETKEILTDTTTTLGELSKVRFLQLVNELKYFEEEAEDYAQNFDKLVGCMLPDIYYKANDRYYIKFCFAENSRKENMCIYLDHDMDFRFLLYSKKSNKIVSIQPGHCATDIRLLSPEDGWRYGNTKRYLIHPKRLEHKESDAHYLRISKEDYTNYIFQDCLLVVLHKCR